MTTWKVALCGLLLAAPAHAQQACGQREAVLAKLGEKYGETRQSIGMAGPRVMEVYANTETGTWTIIVTMPNGMTCLAASGVSFENLSEPPAPQGDPA